MKQALIWLIWFSGSLYAGPELVKNRLPFIYEPAEFVLGVSATEALFKDWTDEKVNALRMALPKSDAAIQNPRRFISLFVEKMAELSPKDGRPATFQEDAQFKFQMESLARRILSQATYEGVRPPLPRRLYRRPSPRPQEEKEVRKIANFIRAQKNRPIKNRDDRSEMDLADFINHHGGWTAFFALFLDDATQDLCVRYRCAPGRTSFEQSMTEMRKRNDPGLAKFASVYLRLFPDGKERCAALMSK